MVLGALRLSVKAFVYLLVLLLGVKISNLIKLKLELK
jgi:hypothetical protein